MDHKSQNMCCSCSLPTVKLLLKNQRCGTYRVELHVALICYILSRKMFKLRDGLIKSPFAFICFLVV
jgi:hypothetical protein